MQGGKHTQLRLWGSRGWFHLELDGRERPLRWQSDHPDAPDGEQVFEWYLLEHSSSLVLTHMHDIMMQPSCMTRFQRSKTVLLLLLLLLPRHAWVSNRTLIIHGWAGETPNDRERSDGYKDLTAAAVAFAAGAGLPPITTGESLAAMRAVFAGYAAAESGTTQHIVSSGAK